ncbi:MAG: phospho-N-acetylmuramoyl-pentapeptide-transferase [Chlamydiales bacterium]|nr:phospho-N-acetylmuramoyl-pentapeptide-transferase [Chlamydiales bacterium]
MILLLIDWLQNFTHIPAVFGYVSTRMILAVLTPLLLVIFLGPRFIQKLYEMKVGQAIRVEDCPTLAKLHQKKKMTPTMGGLLMLAGILLAAILWMDWRSSNTWILIFSLVWMGGVGVIDDLLKLKFKHPKGLAGRKKFALQAIFALCLCAYLYTQGSPLMSDYFVPFKKGVLFSLNGWWLILAAFITVFVIVGCSNAVNLTDGLDGLAAGTVLPVALVFAVFAFLSNHLILARYLNIIYLEGSGEISIFLCAIAGASLGFLWYNGYPAQVFMGDTGSIALGGMLGVAAVLLRREGLLALVGAIFVAEALSVILQVGSYKLRNKKRIFLCTPLHHHFEYKGWPENKVVLRFWLVGLVLAAIGLATLKFQ